jgi:exopolyphosphatase/guanosine-5'-triphosphate,3'-diphosphate pyrophosphatase
VIAVSEEPSRIGVLDVGCFSAHLLVIGDHGSPLAPVLSHKVRLRLDLAIDHTGRIGPAGIERICAAVSQAKCQAARIGVRSVVAFATSSIRDAPNAGQVISCVLRHTGIELRLFAGEQEARLSYIAARHWFGASAGPLTVLDVGGGTAELAIGAGAHPQIAHSLPLGARTLSRVGLTGAEQLATMRAEITDRVRATLPDLSDLSRTRAVGCSKVFQQLARLAGARPQRHGPFVPRHLRLDDLSRWIPRLARLPAHQRALLPGISRHRAHQALAGAVLAETLMQITRHDVVDISPWSTKEGLLITLLHDRRRASCHAPTAL